MYPENDGSALGANCRLRSIDRTPSALVSSFPTHQAKEYPLVSVLVPAFNHERYIVSCLESVANDTYPNLELIVIDDGSRDQTLALIQQWIAQNKHRVGRIIWRTWENRGICATANRLVQEASGEFVALLASDDQIVPGGIHARVVALQQHPEWLAAFGTSTVMDESGTEVRTDAMSALYGTDRTMLAYCDSMAIELILRWAIPGPVFMARREAYDPLTGVGPYDERLQMEDRDFYLRLLARGALGHLEVNVGRYRIHRNNASKPGPASARFRAALLESCVKNVTLFTGFARMCLAAYVRYLRAHEARMERATVLSVSRLVLHRGVVEALLRGSRLWYGGRRVLRVRGSLSRSARN